MGAVSVVSMAILFTKVSMKFTTVYNTFSPQLICSLHKTTDQCPVIRLASARKVTNGSVHIHHS